MATRPVPDIEDPSHLSRGYGANVGVSDFAEDHYGSEERRGRFEEDFDARTRGSSVLDGDIPQRSASRASRVSTTLNQGSAPSRSGTLKKKGSVKTSGSLKRSGSRKSMHAGSIRGVTIDDPARNYDREDSVFYTPVPTKGSPTEILADRFQTWRKFLKDLITYFREVSSSYEHRAKSLLKVSNVINNTNAPAALLVEGGLNDANRILRDFHKQAVLEANKARDIESDVINQLSGLRADLAQKIKEIKSLSGDFKNNVEKEKETTRKFVTALEEALAVVDRDPSAVAGKGDPYVVRLGVERQVERQIDEENYLHRAYLNLENSGRELESIVIGEVQKAYNALASILKRDADEIYSTVEKLRTGPIAMARDYEWIRFVKSDPHFVNPDMPLRRLEDIEYPGKNHPATTEVRAGMLERKSKYLKSYTPGWYVLSPTHIHEFKSADRIYTQPPVMSLYLPDQKIGSRSQPGSSSHKFVVKGRQAGSMHRGHTWVFRAESYETMLAWYDDIKTLTEKTGEERNAFVRRHASVRSASAGSARSGSSDGGLEEDEADAVPFSANQSMANQPVSVRGESTRPSPGGRFPSDLNVKRTLTAPLSSSSSEVGNDLTTAAGGPTQDALYLGDNAQFQHSEPVNPVQQQQEYPAASYVNAYPPTQQAYPQTYGDQQYPSQMSGNDTSRHEPHASIAQGYQNQAPALSQPAPMPQNYQSQPSNANPYPIAAHNHADPTPIARHGSNYGNWMAPAAGGAAAGTLAADVYHRKQMEQRELAQQKELESRAQHQPQEEHYPVAPQPLVQQQAPVQNQEAYYPPEPSRSISNLGVAPAVPERDPDHHAPATIPEPVPAPAVEPTTFSSFHTQPTSTAEPITFAGTPYKPSQSSNTDTTPSTANTSFLDESEVGAAAPASGSHKTINGGPVPVELVEVADAQARPSMGMHRTNTDISVSDLHVPGEYPRGARPSYR